MNRVLHVIHPNLLRRPGSRSCRRHQSKLFQPVNVEGSLAKTIETVILRARRKFGDHGTNVGISLCFVALWREIVSKLARHIIGAEVWKLYNRLTLNVVPRRVSGDT